MLGASMAVTFVSAIAYLSVPVMIYYQGTKNFWNIVSCFLPAIPCALFVLPVLYKIHPSNIYEVCFTRAGKNADKTNTKFQYKHFDRFMNMYSFLFGNV